jgi:hypothetical protein
MNAYETKKKGICSGFDVAKNYDLMTHKTSNFKQN